MYKKMMWKPYKEFLYDDTVFQIDIVQEKDRSFSFLLWEKLDSTIWVDIYRNPREVMRDIKRMSI